MPFKKGCIPWWIQVGKANLMKNSQTARKVAETKKKLFREGKLKPWNKKKPFLSGTANPFYGKKHKFVTKLRIKVNSCDRYRRRSKYHLPLYKILVFKFFLLLHSLLANKEVV